MHEKILHSILPLVLLLVPVATLGQQPQNTASTQAQHTQISVNVYEFDFVDRQPQFPGGDNAMIRFINHVVIRKKPIRRVSRVECFAVSW